ncbi:proteasome activator subunit 4 [Iris pallida]|uniref:Proteasome activator subunit 4 n=1 Tax=Iris pallida TaxID=29817 RepID=A0AAX6DRH2_IRIPA|nr:proteasome activator subunit 4 [Iris pallida]
MAMTLVDAGGDGGDGGGGSTVVEVNVSKVSISQGGDLVEMEMTLLPKLLSDGTEVSV